MNATGVNLAFTKFLFIIPRRDDDSIVVRLRTTASIVARGFFNDFDVDGSRDGQPHETIQFLIADASNTADSGVEAAPYVIQVSGKYRPRLAEMEQELRRRLGDTAEVLSLDGAERAPRYTSAEMFDFAYRRAVARRSGRITRNAIILPISKTTQWWEKPSLERWALLERPDEPRVARLRAA